MRVSSEEESTDLPFVEERSKKPDTSKPTGRPMFSHIFPMIRIVKCVSPQKLPSSVQSRPEAQGDRIYLPPEIGDALMADHEVFNEENESVQELCYYWIQGNSTQNKTAQDTMKSLQKFVPSDQKPGIVHTANSRITQTYVAGVHSRL